MKTSTPTPTVTSTTSTTSNVDFDKLIETALRHFSEPKPTIIEKIDAGGYKTQTITVGQPDPRYLQIAASCIDLKNRVAMQDPDTSIDSTSITTQLAKLISDVG